MAKFHVRTYGMALTRVVQDQEGKDYESDGSGQETRRVTSKDLLLRLCGCECEAGYKLYAESFTYDLI